MSRTSLLFPLLFNRALGTALANDLKVKEEIERLAGDYGELDKPWRFVVN